MQHTGELPPYLMARERDPHPLVLVGVSMLLMGIAVALLLFGARLDTANALVGHPTSFSAPEPAKEPVKAASQPSELVTEVRSISGSRDDAALRGRQAVLIDVKVQAVPGDYTFWVGPDQQTMVPVVLRGELKGRQAETQTKVRPGDVVRVFGVLRQTAGSSVFAEDHLLDAQETDEILKRYLFVEASRVDLE